MLGSRALNDPPQVEPSPTLGMKGGLELLGHVDIEPALAMLNQVEEARWDEHDFRQRLSPQVHAATRSLLIQYHWRGIGVVQDDMLEALRPVTSAVEALVAAHAPGRRVAAGNILLVRLPAGESVSEHVDEGRYLMSVRRIHVPLLVNPDCTLTVDDVEHTPEPGGIYHLHNWLPHAAANRGTTPRVHMICDWMVDGDDIRT